MLTVISQPLSSYPLSEAMTSVGVPRISGSEILKCIIGAKAEVFGNSEIRETVSQLYFNYRSINLEDPESRIWQPAYTC